MNLSKKEISFVIVVVVCLIIGFVSGKEYTKYQIRTTIEDSVKGIFGGDYSEENDKEKKIEGKLLEENDIDGISISLQEIKRFDGVGMETTEGEKLDSAINFKIKVTNNSDKDYNFNEYDVSLLSKVKTNQVKTILSMGEEDEQLKPQLSSNTLIAGGSLEGYITYYMPSDIKESDLELRINVNQKNISYKL